MLWGGVKIWKWIDGEGPPALKPDMMRIEVSQFSTASVKPESDRRGIKNKIVKVVKKIWFWIY